MSFLSIFLLQPLNLNHINTLTPMTLYIVPPIRDERILPESTISSEYIGSEISVSASPGEYKSASFVVHANINITGLEVVATRLAYKGNSIPANNVDIKTVKCWYQAGVGVSEIWEKQLVPELLLKNDSLIKIEDGENYLRLTTGEYIWVSKPDSIWHYPGEIIIPVDSMPVKDTTCLLPVSISKGTNKQFFVTIKVPEDAVDGFYTGYIQLRDSAARITKDISLLVKVLPITLLEPYLIYSIYYGGKLDPNWPDGSISSLYKSEEQMKAELLDMFNHGITNPTLGNLWHPEIQDTAILGQVLRMRNEIGMGGQPLYYLGLQAWQYGTDTASLKEDVTKLVNFVSPYGVTQLYVYVADENDLNTTEHRAQMKAVHSVGGKCFCAMFNIYIKQVADILDLAIAPMMPDTAFANAYHSYNNKIFSYCNPQVGEEMPEKYRRNYGLLLWQKDYDGTMNFAYHCSFGNIWNDFDHPMFRDHNFTYPTIDGVISTLQWEGMREGVNDIRYLTTLIENLKKKPNTEAEQWLKQLKEMDLEKVDLDFIREEIISWISFVIGIEDSLTIKHFPFITPNPSISNVVIDYTCRLKQSVVQITVYDRAGRKIIDLLKDTKKAGTYRLVWNGKDARGKRVPVGTYFINFSIDDYSGTKKAILLK